MPFVKGQSGNPKGRPKGNSSARQAIRESLAKVRESGKTRLDEWAELLTATTDVDQILAILKFLEGVQPQSSEPDDGDDQPRPRIVIPGSPLDPNRPSP